MLGLEKIRWHIKQLISHQKNPNHDTSGSNSLEDVRFVNQNMSINPIKRLSWLSQSPTVEIKPLQCAAGHTTVRTYHTPTANTTARSSATSLCSCDCTANPASIEPPLSEEFPTPEVLHLPRLSPSHASADAQTWRLIFSDSPSRSSVSRFPKPGKKRCSTSTSSARSTTDLIGDLEIEPENGGQKLTQRIKRTYESDMEDLSENVEQLIRETDAAFQAVGTALADAKAAAQAWFETDATVPRNPSLSRSIIKANPTSVNPTLQNQTSRSVALSKIKKPGKQSLLGRTLRSTAPITASTPSRWALNNVTTNMVDVFSGKVFRTEVDEMLTPGRLQLLQDSVKPEKERRESADSVFSAGTDENTPTEPFYLESLSNRISAAQKNLHLAGPVLLPPARRQLKQQTDNISRPPLRKSQFADPEIVGVGVSRMTIDELTFPSPPRVPRRPSASGNISYLPTIPEISTLTDSPADLFAAISTSISSPVHPESDGNYIFLPSNPFSLTSPLFRHGTIRVPPPFREPKPSSSDEEALDWTAFQMAISGTGSIDGYVLADAYDKEERERMELEDEERELDGILEWWAGFGFQGWGRMVGDPRLNKIPKLNCRQQRSLERRLRREAIEKGFGAVGDVKARLRNSGTLTREITDTPKIIAGNQRGNETVTDVQRRESLTDSLPPSPMLDLMVRNQSKDNEFIPMGFNLGHDLGDFLNWEAHHVQTLFADE